MTILHSKDADFPDKFKALVTKRGGPPANLRDDVRAILGDVENNGDTAVAKYTARFDAHALDSDEDWSISPEQCRQAYEAIDPNLRQALDLAAARIRAFHERQIPTDTDYSDDRGVRLGARWRPMESAGIYVPGGRAVYPSSVLMNAIPARIAGVKRIAMVSPTPGGHLNATLMAAAHIAQIDEIWRIGGAQAIGALAYGTERISAVDMIAGPGNAFVAEAKRQLFGLVGVDMVAGPSELLVIADNSGDPAWIAADLLSQAEHDPNAQSVLITDDYGFARLVEDAITAQLGTLSTAETARQSWEQHGAIITVETLSEAPILANALAAEHVELAVSEPEQMMGEIQNAGAIFLGAYACEALGDYVAGPSHVLPTGRSARFASGLSVLSFMKRTSIIGATAGAVEDIGPAAIAIAQAEGLPAHAASVSQRLAKVMS